MRVKLALAALLLTSIPSLAQEDGAKAWEKIHAVLSHPRCANCHTPDDHPRWGADGGARFHAMNVLRGADGMGSAGMRCATCHGENNSSKEHAPPGAPAWQLASVEMVWFGQTSAQICAQIKDPQRNGSRTLAEIAEHVKNDALVAWGWSPGPGREPAPGSAEKTYAALNAWSAAGAPCPAD
jgi:mono/diheme cytochrome c family protein